MRGCHKRLVGRLDQRVHACVHTAMFTCVQVHAHVSVDASACMHALPVRKDCFCVCGKSLLGQMLALVQEPAASWLYMNKPVSAS
jgi:hypothetical protein